MIQCPVLALIFLGLVMVYVFVKGEGVYCCANKVMQFFLLFFIFYWTMCNNVLFSGVCIRIRPDGKQLAVSTMGGHIHFFSPSTAVEEGCIEGRHDLGLATELGDEITAEKNQSNKWGKIMGGFRGILEAINEFCPKYLLM